MKYILPISYLGPIQYYAFLIQKKNVFIESQEHFVKQSIRNRCFIYGGNGKHILTVPKNRKSSSKTIISEILISNKTNWQRSHYESIKSAYNSAPFFEYYKDHFKNIYSMENNNLFNFNLKLINEILTLLEIKKYINITSHYTHNLKGLDLRNHDFNSNKLKKYPQVFENKHGFIPNLSILDLFFNIGPESTEYLKNLSI